MILEYNSLLTKIAKELNLEHDEYDDFIHDVKNLRGDEWLEVIEENCSKKTTEDFKNLINNNF